RGQYDLPAPHGPTRQPLPASRRGINPLPPRPPSRPPRPPQRFPARHTRAPERGTGMAMAPATSPRHLLLLLFLWLCAAASTAWAHGGGGDADSGDADGGGEAKPDLRARGLVATKLWCLALVFAGTLAGGVSPYFMRWNEAFLALGTQFAGGVFLSTAMMHFLSDANETFGDLLPHSEYPFAFMLACAGYVLTMLAECAISSVVARGRTAPAAAAAPATSAGES
uniref:Uncharacterized protein n=3 Tax=Aegilops tauschii subsp. strangulata TaxID=200361 RepID=A0A453N6M2_AEGTS